MFIFTQSLGVFWLYFIILQLIGNDHICGLTDESWPNPCARVARSAIKPSIAQSVHIKATSPLDHAAPAMLHKPKGHSTSETNCSAVGGGGVSGPSGREFHEDIKS
jgi:hypothetical protein